MFFAYIGFDAVSTLAEETKNPQRDVPRGMIASLLICTLLYIVVSGIMVGAMHYSQLGGDHVAAPMAKVLDHLGYGWGALAVAIGAIAGITSVLIVLLNSQARIVMRMSRDGLVGPVFGKIHSRFSTPANAIVMLSVPVALLAGLVPISELADLVNVGTLAAFVLVCLGVIILRRVEPDHPRAFRCPGYPYVPALGALLSAVMMITLMIEVPATFYRFSAWMLAGIVIYFAYSRRHSRLNVLPAGNSPQG